MYFIFLVIFILKKFTYCQFSSYNLIMVLDVRLFIISFMVLSLITKANVIFKGNREMESPCNQRQMGCYQFQNYYELICRIVNDHLTQNETLLVNYQKRGPSVQTIWMKIYRILKWQTHTDKIFDRDIDNPSQTISISSFILL